MQQRTVILPEHLGATCRTCALVSTCLPRELAADAVERFDAIVRRARPLQRGDFIFREDSRFHSLFVVKTGSVKTCAPGPAGDEQVLGFHFPGDVIGLDAIDGAMHRCSAQVLETAAICEIPFARLEELAAGLPPLQHRMYRLLGQELGHATEALRLLAHKSAEARLAAFLLGLSRRLHQRGLSACDFHLSMSRHEIASYLGLAVETVSRLLTRFQQEGLMRVDRKHIELLDLAALETLLGSPRARVC